MMFTVIVFGGVFVGVVKGQQAKQKWLTKKKNKYIVKKNFHDNKSWVVLDEIEMATWHR